MINLNSIKLNHKFKTVPQQVGVYAQKYRETMSPA